MELMTARAERIWSCSGISGDTAEEVSSTGLPRRCHCAVSPRQTARTKLESSAAAAVIGVMELMPRRTAQRE